MRPSLLVPLLLALLASTGAGQALTTKRIASGLTGPAWAGAPAGDDRVFIAQTNGVVKIWRNGAVLGTNYLSIKTQVLSGGERGLLGCAFHPDYANNGYFYTNYTDLAGNTVVSRWTVKANNPDRIDHDSEVVLLTQTQPQANHNGGWLAFGPTDGYLYIGFGDGGGANDPPCNAQDPGTFHGKMLRIDVDSGSPYSVPADNPFVDEEGYLPEIFHLGLRNPWRNGFDRTTGDLWIGDVGQAAREEISLALAGEKGINFGWKVLEGTKCNSSAGCGQIPGCASAEYRPPVYELVHQQTGGPGSVIGGYVYRGCAIPGLQGTYFFADYRQHRIWSFRYDTTTGTRSEFTNRTTELTPGGGQLIRNISSFGEDGFGELLIVDYTAGNGEVFKIVEASAVAATNVTRNGSGLNPVCYTTTSLPVRGNRWSAEVDVSGHPGATFAGIVGYQGPSSGVFLPGGESLVDQASGKIFQILLAVGGDTVSFEGSMPCDSSLNGLTAYTQAFILGGGWELCNAVDVTLGGY
jgi:glucose/arabinose dehydrogenase